MRWFAWSALSALMIPFSAFGSVDPALLAMVPPEMTLVTGVDADRARASSFGQYILSRTRNGDEHFEQFISETGFDPRRDLDSFVFASGGSRQQGHFVVFARGIFDEIRMKAAAQAHGAVVESYRGTDLLVHHRSSGQSSAQSSDRSTGFAFLDATTAMLGDVPTLKQVLDERGSAPLAESPLAAAVRKTNETNDVWYVSSLPGTVLATKVRQETGETETGSSGALHGVVESRGGIRFGDVVQFSFDARTRSAQDAQALEDLLRFLASAAQMQRNSDPQAAILASSLDTLSLEKNDRDMHAGLSITEDNLERLVSSLPGARRATGRAR